MTDPTPQAVQDSGVDPRNEIERRIVVIWRELMDNDDIGVTDDFWELGGHSLLGQQIMARISDELKVDPPLLLLFEAPTVETLAVAITSQIIDEMSQVG